MKKYAEIKGYEWEARYPFCAGCPELILGEGCGYKGNGCKYPERRTENPMSVAVAYTALVKTLSVGLEDMNGILGPCVGEPRTDALERIRSIGRILG